MAADPSKAHIEQLDIWCYFDQQRFIQFGAMDCANFYGISVESGKKQQALYPMMGRKHVTFQGQNRLIFNAKPRALFKSIDFIYVVDGSILYQIDKFYNQRTLNTNISLNGAIWFDTLPVDTTVINMLTDGTTIFLITETSTGTTCVPITDSNRPKHPTYVAAFGNRFVISDADSPNFFLSTINADTGAGSCFTINGAPLFARASGVIGQFAVLHNQLYILCDFVTDVWANIATQITVGGITREFPWKLNSSYNFDYGIADPNSLSVDFAMMTWLAQNKNGLITFMMSSGGNPDVISSQAVNVVLENSTNPGTLSPFLTAEVDGFLYQWENTIFYRVSAGDFLNFGDLDIEDDAKSLEYNFETKKWCRAIELNGERNRIQKHVYFNNQHLVIVQGEKVIYEMAGNVYYNELQNPAQLDPQAPDAFLKYPMRYELTTKQISLDDYAEFQDEYVQIDFVFGNQTFIKSDAPFLNTIFIVDELSTDASPIYMLTEDGKYIVAENSDTPTFDDNHYNTLFKPYLELYYSDDGGETFLPADLREFSQLGQYRWLMRWYELATSRNRCYKLVCVSSAPIVILGGVRNTKRISGGAN